MISLTQLRFWWRYCLAKFRTGSGFCEGAETLLSSTALITLYYGLEKKWNIILTVYNTGRREGEYELNVYASNLKLYAHLWHKKTEGTRNRNILRMRLMWHRIINYVCSYCLLIFGLIQFILKKSTRFVALILMFYRVFNVSCFLYPLLKCMIKINIKWLFQLFF
jgi:hypothetical protein